MLECPKEVSWKRRGPWVELDRRNHRAFVAGGGTSTEDSSPEVCVCVGGLEQTLEEACRGGPFM